MLIAIIAALLAAGVMFLMVLIVVRVQIEDRQATIRYRPAGRVVAAVRRITGLHVRGYDDTACADEKNDSKEEVHV